MRCIIYLKVDYEDESESEEGDGAYGGAYNDDTLDNIECIPATPKVRRVAAKKNGLHHGYVQHWIKRR